MLCLPIWKTASETVYDLLVGHEVGHALYTPNEDFTGAKKSFMNVLEDARIERMMKVTYPGLRKSFFEGYKELWDQDFFGVKDQDPQTLSLIDRINLYFKGNPRYSICRRRVGMGQSCRENKYVSRCCRSCKGTL